MLHWKNLIFRGNLQAPPAHQLRCFGPELAGARKKVKDTRHLKWGLKIRLFIAINWVIWSSISWSGSSDLHGLSIVFFFVLGNAKIWIMEIIYAISHLWETQKIVTFFALWERSRFQTGSHFLFRALFIRTPRNHPKTGKCTPTTEKRSSSLAISRLLVLFSSALSYG